VHFSHIIAFALTSYRICVSHRGVKSSEFITKKCGNEESFWGRKTPNCLSIVVEGVLGQTTYFLDFILYIWNIDILPCHSKFGTSYDDLSVTKIYVSHVHNF